MENREVAYTLRREETREQTGFFVASPVEDMTMEEAVAQLRLRPMDDFLHQYVLKKIKNLSPKDMEQFLERAEVDNDKVCLALSAQYLLLFKGRGHLAKRFSMERVREFSQYTPLVYLRSFLEPDQSLHSQWTALFRQNIQQHAPLPKPAEASLPLLRSKPGPAFSGPVITITDLAAASARNEASASDNTMSASQAADTAIEQLEKAGVELGQLMRHEASLSPIGLLRTWKFRTRTNNRRNCFSLSSEQTSYGRGLDPDTARASLMMEIVERYSAFASVSADGLVHYRNAYPIRYASYSELTSECKDSADAKGVLDPNALTLETPYGDQPLHWVQGETPDPGGRDGKQPFWVPVQCLFLFSNLDEPSLFSGLGSTGLASGSTQAQARLAALLEIIERHQAATVPYNTATCFRLTAGDGQISGLLEAYRRSGIDIWFQDITPATGVPCCRCFVAERSGIIHTGTAAHLDARRAIVAAITETAFPNSVPTRPGPSNQIVVAYERLPDYSAHNAEADLSLLENLLVRNHYRPCYVDLTRADIGLPVVKALIPGMEMLGDFDDYSRVHPELFQNFLDLFK